MFEKEAKHEYRQKKGVRKSLPECTVNIVSLCRIAGVDYLTGDLLDSCIDQQN